MESTENFSSRHESFHTAAAYVMSAPEFWAYPRAKEHQFQEKPRQNPKNPALRGLAVKFSSTALPLIPGLPGVFYKNAGWASIRDVDGLKEAEPRYDPTVIPYRPHQLDDDVSSYTNVQKLRQPSHETISPYSSVIDYHEAYKSGETTPMTVVQALFPLIRRDAENPTEFSRAWLDLKQEIILKAATASTDRWRQGQPLGVLDGVPVGVKDEADLKGYYKKCLGSKIDFTDPSDTTSWCVSKWEEQGAIIMGKLSMHEVGLDTSNNNPNFGSPINPYNKEYYPGGSSGGSASAVGAGLLPIALGCDGGGSIRIPSAWCGIYGLKTTHGWVSMRPYESRAKSTSVAGPMAANMVDLEVAWRVMAQPDPEEVTSRQFPFPVRQPSSAVKKFGICRAWFDRADAPVKEACQRAIIHFKKKLGYEVVEISIPHLRESQMAHALTILNEATSGLSKPDLKKLLPPNQILITVGRSASARDFLEAQRLRTLVMEHLAYLFKTHPGLLIITPTTPNAGWPIHKGDAKFGASNGNQSIRNMEYVWLANFTGIPAITMPVGYVDPVQGQGRIPVGLMAHAEWGNEDQLLDFGYEGQTYLNEILPGGRVQPVEYVDVLARVAAERAASLEGAGEAGEKGEKVEKGEKGEKTETSGNGELVVEEKKNGVREAAK